MPVKGGGEIGQRAAGIFDDETSRARMFFFALGNDHRGAFFDSLPDEIVSVIFLPRSATNMPFLCTRRESYAMLSTARSSGPMISRIGIAPARDLSCMRIQQHCAKCSMGRSIA